MGRTFNPNPQSRSRWISEFESNLTCSLNSRTARASLKTTTKASPVNLQSHHLHFGGGGGKARIWGWGGGLVSEVLDT